jgi:NADH:ubiquinone oxidoreductase subunit E
MVGEAPAPAQLSTPDERAAVDATLADFPTFERSALLPVLQAVQRRSGSLSKGLLGYLGERVSVPFAEVYGVASFYALLSTDHPAPRIRLCSGVPCILAGAEDLAEHLRSNATLEWAWFPCIGQCDRAPAALVGDEPRYNLTSGTLLDVLDGYH